VSSSERDRVPVLDIEANKRGTAKTVFSAAQFMVVPALSQVFEALQGLQFSSQHWSRSHKQRKARASLVSKQLLFTIAVAARR
jgi:hypothetical protein